MTEYTRTETIEAEQWNGPEDNPFGVVEEWINRGKTYYCIPSPVEKADHVLGAFTHKGCWIIERVDVYTRYEVISDKKFKAQGWKAKARTHDEKPLKRSQRGPR